MPAGQLLRKRAFSFSSKVDGSGSRSTCEFCTNSHAAITEGDEDHIWNALRAYFGAAPRKFPLLSFRL